MPPKAPSPAPQKTNSKFGKFGRIRKKEKPTRKRKTKEQLLQPKRQLKLRGCWLKTPQDWARFDAWAKDKALPKKVPDPEPIVRPAKPINKLLKRIQKLSRPVERLEAKAVCREWIITSAALHHNASRRLIRLSWPIVRFPPECRDVAPPVAKGALKYEPTVRIIKLSAPKSIVFPDDCKPYTSTVSKGAIAHKTTEREGQLALAKKLHVCPELLSEEERQQLFTPSGTRKSALRFKMNEWLDLLALPWYKNLKHRKDETAENMKKRLEEELEKRGKEAYSKQIEQKEKSKGSKGKAGRKKGSSDDQGAGDTSQSKTSVKDDAKAKKEEKRKKRQNAWRYAPPACKDEAFETSRDALKFEGSPRLDTLAKAKERGDNVTKRNPFGVRQGALSATASPVVVKLAQPKMPRDPVEKKPDYPKDKYGRPLIKKPRYGKRLPKPPPYVPRDCPDDKAEEKQSKQQIQKESTHSLAYKPSIDPLMSPRQAKQQQTERQKVKSRGTNPRNKE